MEKKLVLIDTISTHRIRYAVEIEATDNDKAIEYALDNWILEQENVDFKEFSQKHMGSMDISSRVISREEYLKVFDQDNDYMKDFTNDVKFNFINRIKD